MTTLFDKHRVAKVVQALPWLMNLATRLYGFSRPRYSVGVVGVLLNAEGSFLLVDHVYHTEPTWGLPGGWLEPNEDPAAGVLREIREETGIHAQLIEPLMILPNSFALRRHLDVAFLCHTDEDVGALSPELKGYRWLRFGEPLPRLPAFHALAIQQGAYKATSTEAAEASR